MTLNRIVALIGLVGELELDQQGIDHRAYPIRMGHGGHLINPIARTSACNLMPITRQPESKNLNMVSEYKP